MKIRAIILLLVLGWWPIASLQAQWTNERANGFIDWALSQHPRYDIDSVFTLSDSLMRFVNQAEDPCLYVRVKTLNARLLSTKRESEKALAACIDADKVLQTNDCSLKIKVQLLSAFASIYYQVSSNDKSVSSATTALRLCKGGGCDTVQVIRLYMVMSLNQKSTNPNRLIYLDSALTLATSAGNTYWKMRILVNTSSTYAKKGDFNNGKSYARQAIESARKMKAYYEVSVLYNNLAGMSQSNDTILAYVDSAIYYAGEAKSITNQQAYTQNKAMFYTMIGEWKDGYNTLWKALSLKDTIHKRAQVEAIAEMDEKYEAEKRNAEIQQLKVEGLNTELEKIRYQKNQTRLMVGAIALVLIIGFLSYSVVSIRKNRNILAAKNKEISKERKRSEELLLNILPAEIAQELKETGKAQARHFDLVTILFTDIVDFTQIADEMDTEELIAELNICFKRFDEITQKYGLEKIKTIGDSYMAAGGIPVDRGNVARSTVLAALDMQDFMIERSLQKKAIGKIGFDMRIGIHTGPVVAGIVGVKKFQYDVWGDTVNTASRMENASEAQLVNISLDTYELVKHEPNLQFEARGKVNVKGKGSINMYFVSRQTIDD